MKHKNNIETEILDKKPIFLLFITILLMISTVISSSQDILPGTLGNTISFSIYLLFLGVYIWMYSEFELPKKPVMAFAGIYFVFLVGFIRDSMGLINHPSSYLFSASDAQLFIHTAEVASFIIGSITLVFIFPKVIRRDWFVIVLVAISTTSIFLGIPAYLIGDYTFFGVNINTYTTLEPLRQYGIRIPALASIWGDANAMSKFALAGLLGSHYLYTRFRSNSWLLLLGLHALGLFIANSKMAVIAAILTYSVYFVYKIFGKSNAIVYLIISGIAGSILFCLIIMGIGTDAFVSSVGFSARVALWRASIFTFSKHPIIGVGIHNVGNTISAYTTVSSLAPQNSYLAIFVAGGIVGGILYLWVIITYVFKYIQIIDTESDLLMLCLLISFILVQFTDTAHVFGVNKNALVFAVTLGYVITEVHNRV